MAYQAEGTGNGKAWHGMGEWCLVFVSGTEWNTSYRLLTYPVFGHFSSKFGTFTPRACGMDEWAREM